MIKVENDCSSVIIFKNSKSYNVVFKLITLLQFSSTTMMRNKFPVNIVFPTFKTWWVVVFNHQQ